MKIEPAFVAFGFAQATVTNTHQNQLILHLFREIILKNKFDK